MSPVSPPLDAHARNCAPRLVQALARVPVKSIADAIGKDESVASRVRSGEARLTLHEFCALIDLAGQKLVGADNVCVSKDRYSMLAGIASAAMSNPSIVQQLVWEDEK